MLIIKGNTQVPKLNPNSNSAGAEAYKANEETLPISDSIGTINASLYE